MHTNYGQLFHYLRMQNLEERLKRHKFKPVHSKLKHKTLVFTDTKPSEKLNYLFKNPIICKDITHLSFLHKTSFHNVFAPKSIALLCRYIHSNSAIHAHNYIDTLHNTAACATY